MGQIRLLPFLWRECDPLRVQRCGRSAQRRTVQLRCTSAVDSSATATAARSARARQRAVAACWRPAPSCCCPEPPDGQSTLFHARGSIELNMGALTAPCHRHALGMALPPATLLTKFAATREKNIRALQQCTSTQTCVGVTFNHVRHECTLHTSAPVGVTNLPASSCRQSRCSGYGGEAPRPT